MEENKTLPTYFCRSCENPLALGEISSQKIHGNNKKLKFVLIIPKCLDFHLLYSLISRDDRVYVKMNIGKIGGSVYVSHAMNVVVGPKIGRKLITGSYVVADVMCSKCGETLGWKYVETFELRQRFKEGMFVLQKLKLTKRY